MKNKSFKILSLSILSVWSFFIQSAANQAQVARALELFQTVYGTVEYYSTLDALENVIGTLSPGIISSKNYPNVLTVESHNFLQLQSFNIDNYMFTTNSNTLPFPAVFSAAGNLTSLLQNNFQVLLKNGFQVVFIGVDVSGNFIINYSNLKGKLDHFELYVYDLNGQLVGSPIKVPVAGTLPSVSGVGINNFGTKVTSVYPCSFIFKPEVKNTVSYYVVESNGQPFTQFFLYSANKNYSGQNDFDLQAQGFLSTLNNALQKNSVMLNFNYIPNGLNYDFSFIGYNADTGQEISGLAYSNVLTPYNPTNKSKQSNVFSSNFFAYIRYQNTQNSSQIELPADGSDLFPFDKIKNPNGFSFMVQVKK